MNPRSWLYSLRVSLQSVTRTGLMSVASVSTVAVSLLVLAVVVLLAANLQNVAKTMESQVEIRVYMKENQSDDVKTSLQQRITAMPGVASATYVSKEQALQQFKQEFKDQKDVLEGLDQNNPLRDLVQVKASDPKLVPGLAGDILTLPGVAEANYGKDTVDRLLRFTQAVRVAGLALVILLLVATVFTISNTIRLAVYARRREVQIMKLVGATDWFIRRPFIFEGVLLGGLGSALALLVTGVGYQYVVTGMATTMPFLPMINANQIMGLVSGGLLATGCILGAIGSAISLRRFLHV